MNPARLFLSNPEFRRNLSLELTGGRLWWTPSFLAVATGLPFLLDQPLPDRVEIAQWVVVGLWLLAGLVWGALRAGQAVHVERAANTWDSQRLTDLSAGEFAVGKALGATAHNLYIQLILLVLWGVLSALRLNLDPSEISATAAWLVPLLLVLASLVLWPWMVAASFLDPSPSRSVGSSAFHLAAPGAFAILLVGNFWFDLLVSTSSRLSGGMETERWWDIQFGRPHLALLILFLFLPWAWFGLWRTLRRDLQHADFPWAWPVFLVYLGLCVQGFQQHAGKFPTGAVALAVLFYGFLASETLDPVRLRRLIHGAGSLRDRISQGVPLTWTTYGVFSLACLGTALAATQWRGLEQGKSTFALGWVLLGLRDLLLFSWISLRVPASRQSLSRVALAVALHVFLPLLAGILADTELVWPGTSELSSRAGLVGLGFLATQAGLAVALCGPRILARIREA